MACGVICLHTLLSTLRNNTGVRYGLRTQHTPNQARSNLNYDLHFGSSSLYMWWPYLNCYPFLSCLQPIPDSSLMCVRICLLNKHGVTHWRLFFFHQIFCSSADLISRLWEVVCSYRKKGSRSGPLIFLSTLPVYSLIESVLFKYKAFKSKYLNLPSKKLLQLSFIF